jgi:hypothetical protein
VEADDNMWGIKVFGTVRQGKFFLQNFFLTVLPQVWQGFYLLSGNTAIVIAE